MSKPNQYHSSFGFHEAANFFTDSYAWYGSGDAVQKLVYVRLHFQNKIHDKHSRVPQTVYKRQFNLNKLEYQNGNEQLLN